MPIGFFSRWATIQPLRLRFYENGVMKPTPELERSVGHSDLNGRQRLVLKEVCDAFITTGIPVGSRTISRHSNLSCSPATIRNEMADLEELGYLFSPHTSAGRVPTEKGYRFYVDCLLQFERINQIEQTVMGLLTKRFEEHQNRNEAFFRSVIRLACAETKLGGLIMTPQLHERQWRAIRLLRILEDKALLVLVDESGAVTDELIAIDPAATDGDLEKLSNLLNSHLSCRTMMEKDLGLLRKSNSLLARYNDLLARISERIRAATVSPTHENTIFLDGFVNFFEQPEFSDPQKMRGMVNLLDRKEILLKVLAEKLAAEEDIMIHIGSESGLAIDDLSLVTARYLGPNNSVGQIGMIGPLRMDYRRVVATLGHISKALTQLFIQPNMQRFKGKKDE